MDYVRSGCSNGLVCLVFFFRLGGLGLFTNLFSLGDAFTHLCSTVLVSTRF